MRGFEERSCIQSKQARRRRHRRHRTAHQRSAWRQSRSLFCLRGIGCQLLASLGVSWWEPLDNTQPLPDSSCCIALLSIATAREPSACNAFCWDAIWSNGLNRALLALASINAPAADCLRSQLRWLHNLILPEQLELMVPPSLFMGLEPGSLLHSLFADLLIVPRNNKLVLEDRII